MADKNRTQLLTYWGTLGLCILPAVFLMRGDLAKSIAMLSILIIAYFLAPNFRRYRKTTRKLGALILATNCLGAVIYIINMMDDAWRSPMAILWAVIFFIMTIPVEKDLKREGEL